MSSRILVIGAGVSGLTTATCLVESGFEVKVVAEKRARCTASVVAGALWEWPPAVCGHHTDLDSLRRSKQWSMASYERFQQLADDPRTGVSMVPAVFYFRRRIEDCPKEQRKMEEAAAHVLQFERSPALIDRYGVSRDFGVCDAYRYLAPLIETDVYTDWLRSELVKIGCRFEQRKLTRPLTNGERSLRAKYGASAIVNCTGLGSMELAGDSMQPLRGALIRMHNDGVATPRITAAHCLAHDDAARHQQMIYILPRGTDRLLLGGIAELGEWDTDIDLDNHQPIRDMLQRCRQFMPALQSAVIDDREPVRVGLRPHREKNVRLEREPAHRIVHNYGHGGSGFTFSWGCAQEATQLVKSVLKAECAA